MINIRGNILDFIKEGELFDDSDFNSCLDQLVLPEVIDCKIEYLPGVRPSMNEYKVVSGGIDEETGIKYFVWNYTNPIWGNKKRRADFERLMDMAENDPAGSTEYYHPYDSGYAALARVISDPELSEKEKKVTYLWCLIAHIMFNPPYMWELEEICLARDTALQIAYKKDFINIFSSDTKEFLPDNRICEIGIIPKNKKDIFRCAVRLSEKMQDSVIFRFHSEGTKTKQVNRLYGLPEREMA